MNMDEVEIKDFHIPWGKVYRCGNKDNEVKPPTSIASSVEICCCGRSDSPSGTEGSFNLVDKANNKIIGTYYWDCPWGSKTNTSTWTPVDSSSSSPYLTQVTGANLDSGALGNVSLRCAKF